MRFADLANSYIKRAFPCFFRISPTRYSYNISIQRIHIRTQQTCNQSALYSSFRQHYVTVSMSPRQLGPVCSGTNATTQCCVYIDPDGFGQSCNNGKSSCFGIPVIDRTFVLTRRIVVALLLGSQAEFNSECATTGRTPVCRSTFPIGNGRTSTTYSYAA